MSNGSPQMDMQQDGDGAHINGINSANGSPFDDKEKMRQLDFQTRHFLHMIRRMMPHNKTDHTQVDIETEAYKIGEEISKLKRMSIRKVSSSKATGLVGLFNDMDSHLQNIMQ
jgi:hypothetical protein